MNKTIAKLQERIEELVSENEAWKKEAKRWRDMYIEYDEMLEKDLEKAKTRIANVTSKIKSLEKEINDEKY
jgi:predicted  nucleic acid-binding Zn-ribbon protein